MMAEGRQEEGADLGPYSTDTRTRDKLDSLVARTDLASGQVLTTSTFPPFIVSAGRTKRFLQEKKMTRKPQENSEIDPQGPWGKVDCVFCNFPWGENIFEYYNETENILNILGKELNSGCECAFITKQQLSVEILNSSGFIMRDVISIGDEIGKEKGQGHGQGRGRGKSNQVPHLKGKKESNRSYGNDDKGKTGDCFVTFAIVV